MIPEPKYDWIKINLHNCEDKEQKKNFIQYFNISLQTNDFNLGCFVQTQFLNNVFLMNSKAYLEFQTFQFASTWKA